jgi:hypothetical protein
VTFATSDFRSASGTPIAYGKGEKKWGAPYVSEVSLA